MAVMIDGYGHITRYERPEDRPRPSKPPAKITPATITTQVVNKDGRAELEYVEVLTPTPLDKPRVKVRDGELLVTLDELKSIIGDKEEEAKITRIQAEMMREHVRPPPPPPPPCREIGGKTQRVWRGKGSGYVSPPSPKKQVESWFMGISPPPMPRARQSGQSRRRLMKKTAPDQAEYKQEAIISSVNKRLIENKSFNLPATIGPILVAGGLVIFNADVLVGMGIGSMVFAAGQFGYEWFFKREQYALEYVKSLNVRLKEFLVYKEQELKYEFKELKRPELDKQLERLQTKFDTFREVLALKFTPGEMVFSRYMGAAETVHHACYDNLTNMLLAIKAVNAIDSEEIERQMKDADSERMETLKQRLTYHQMGLDDINRMFDLNEEAMTTLDAAMAEIRNLKDDGSENNVDDAIGDMTDMTDMIHKFKPTVTN